MFKNICGWLLSTDIMTLLRDDNTNVGRGLYCTNKLMVILDQAKMESASTSMAPFTSLI